MAKNKAKMNKFVTGVATAAMVATAVVPVASAAGFTDLGDNVDAGVKADIDKAVTLGFFKDAAKFNPSAQITRGQAALTLARYIAGGDDQVENYAIEHDLESKVTLFNDIPVSYKTGQGFEKELYYASLVVKNAGAFTQTNLNPAGPVTRSQMAKIVTQTFGLEKAEGYVSTITDIDHLDAATKGFIETIASQKVTVVDKFMPAGAVTRSQMASFLVRANDAAEVDVDATVTSVMAINANTLTVTGTGLKDLTAEDITVEDNTVSTVTVAEDGKTATVKLKNPLVVDVATKVTVKDASFDVTYKIEATGVKIAEGQFFDDDTEKQFIQILVDGKAVTAQELITAGYTVEFEAFDRRNGGSSQPIFRGGLATSTTGELADEILLAGAASVDYHVTVTLTKGSDVFVTPNTKITVKNLDSAVNSITNGVLVVTSNSTFNSQFIAANSTLAAGDTANFRELYASVGGTNEVVNLSGIDSMYSVKSSDESIVSVDKVDHTLTAEGPGTATITVTYGGATYTKTLTVKSEKRKIATAKLNKTSVNIGEATAAGDFKVQILDQYGDPVNALADTDFTVHSSDETVATATVGPTPSTDGKLEYKVTLDGVDTGTADFTIRNAADTRIGSSVRVNVTDNVSISKYTLTVDNAISAGDVAKVVTAGGIDATKNNVSTTSTIDTGDKKYVKIDVKALNSANQQLQAPTAGTDFEVTSVNASDSDVLDNTFDTDGVFEADDYLIVKAGSNDGTVTITITDKNNSNVKQTIRLTVTDKGVAVTKVAFKNIPTVNYATTLDFEDFLSYTNSSAVNDPRINGLTLSRTYSQSVRLNAGVVGTTTLSDVDSLYIDLDGDGTFTVGEPIVGYVGMATTGDVYVGGSVNTTAVDAITGYAVEAGSDGNVIFRVYNDKDEIVTTKAVKVDF